MTDENRSGWGRFFRRGQKESQNDPNNGGIQAALEMNQTPSDQVHTDILRLFHDPAHWPTGAELTRLYAQITDPAVKREVASDLRGFHYNIDASGRVLDRGVRSSNSHPDNSAQTIVSSGKHAEEVAQSPVTPELPPETALAQSLVNNLVDVLKERNTPNFPFFETLKKNIRALTTEIARLETKMSENFDAALANQLMAPVLPEISAAMARKQAERQAADALRSKNAQNATARDVAAGFQGAGEGIAAGGAERSKQDFDAVLEKLDQIKPYPETSNELKAQLFREARLIIQNSPLGISQEAFTDYDLLGLTSRTYDVIKQVRQALVQLY